MSTASPPPTASRSLCACGSGLPADRCCALDWTRPWPAAAPAEIERARAAMAAGDPAAERLLVELAARAPASLPVLSLLHDLRARQNREPAAEALLRRIVRLDPNNPGAAVALAARLFGRGALEDAERHARDAVRLAPDDPRPHNLMGLIMTEARQPQAGEHHYRRVIELAGPSNAALLANLAWNLKTQGRIDEARELYRRSIALAPNAFNALYGWARMEEADRQYARAGELLDAAEKVAPGHPHLALQRAVLQIRLKAYDEALAMLDDLQRRTEAAGPPVDLGFRVDLFNERGAVLDKLGRYPEAFAAYGLAKQAMRELTGRSYEAEEAARLAGRLKGFFTADRLKLLPRAAPRPDAPTPIFIVGFPRSGTTMVEQTLSAHPLISAGDELPIFGEMVDLAPRLLGSPLPYPEALADLWLGDKTQGLDLLRDYYLQRARQLGAVGEGARWFTDKMPLNETHLGLIGLMFPSAPVIHLVRHPLDVVLSTFANHMTHGFNCASDLVSIARHYVLTADLVEHYRREAAPNILTVRYEDVIDDQEAWLRRMLDFIGAPFDERCLSFHENRRYARTASYAQVAEKLHDRSRYRYRAYREQLAPVVPILGPVIRRLGYDL
jgi:Tfp pilus assembly protein PilF